MKKIILAFFGLLVMISLGKPGTVSSATPLETPSKLENQVQAVVQDSDTDTQVTKTEYVLPYPGILPDHPLYIVKQLRDRIMEWLISDPIRKIEYYILQSDKLINAAVFLNDKGNAVLTEKTVSESNMLMDKAVTLTTEFSKQGKTIPAYIIEKIGNSTGKHKEVIGGLIETAKEAQKTAYQASLEKVNALESTIGSFVK